MVLPEMSKSTLIVQISDCHLPASPRQKYRGINPLQNLKALMQKVKALKPDLILASGDLSEDGSRDSYRVLQRKLNSFDVPVLALPGNHDDVDLLAQFFPGSPVDTIEVSAHGPWHVIRLNSCLPGKPEGQLSEKTLLDLESLLQQHGEGPLLIALHHQPISTGSPWIDKYRLLDPENLLCLIDQYPNVRAVVWGHVHQAFETDRNGTAMLAGPSSAINALPGEQKFTPDTQGPACRWFELGEDKSFLSGIVQA